MENGVMIQYFEWNIQPDGKHWNRLKEDAKHLSEIGVSAVWIPPAYKGTSVYDVGYGTYDLWDLGEFDQKGTIGTKYGTKDELQSAIAELHKYNISIYLDVVLNHKGGADETERFMAQEVDFGDRNRIISEPYEIEGWTKFTFPGRNGQYSDFVWNYNHFNGTDYNNANGKTALYKILGEFKDWDKGVDSQYGNYDYLMYANIDFNHPDVRSEVIKWGKWVAKELNLDGFRLDAVKHISDEFVKEFLTEVRKEVGDSFYSVGEYWKDNLEELRNYLANVGYETGLFDVSLHYNMYEASVMGAKYDLRRLTDDTILVHDAMEAVSFVDNHDSQWGSALQSQVEDWFKPQAYALILLSKSGYPCLFYGDYYGVSGNESIHKWVIDQLLKVRKNNAYGEQHNYFDHPRTVAMYRTGKDGDLSTGCATVFSNGNDGNKWIEVGKNRAGQIWEEVTGTGLDKVEINQDGWGNFAVKGGKVAVWVPAV